MDLWTYEREQWAAGYETICGVDEAGAGPLAGPVYAAAVILPRELDIPGLNDSKKLTEKKREALYGLIIAQAAAWAMMRPYRASRFFSVSFLESLRPGMSSSRGRMTAAAYTGPARGPAPASSTPQMVSYPAAHCSRSYVQRSKVNSPFSETAFRCWHRSRRPRLKPRTVRFPSSKATCLLKSQIP